MKTKQATISKISPLVIGKVVRRKRLFALLDRKSPTRSFWISGPGGSGKTTLVASYLKERKIPGLWYQIDALDGDPATFFYYLGQAAASLMEPTASPMPLLTPECLPSLETFVLRYFEILYQRIPPGSWLIFDNFQDAPEETVLQQILVSAVKQLPENATVAIISRSIPPPVFFRFIANRTMREVTGYQMTFSPEEFAGFLKLTGSRVDEESAKQLYQITKGWITGAILWLLQFERDATTEKFPADCTPQNIFDYFAAEILDKTAPSIKNFLLQTAFLPHMTADIASELTEMRAEDILEILNRKNYFIEKRRLPAAGYQYYAPFREFLQITAARAYSPAFLQKIYFRAAGIFDRHGWREEAIDLYSKANAHDSVAAIILDLAPTLIAQGRYKILSSWIESLPEEYSKENPRLLFWNGFAQMVSNPLKARSLCTMAYELLTRRHDLTGQVLSWTAIIEIFFILRSGFSDLDRWIEEGERLGELLSNKDYDPDLFGRFASSKLMALLLRNQGHPDLEKWQNQCETLLVRCNDLQVTVNLLKNLFWSYHWLGQADKVRQTEARMKVLQNTDDLPPIVQLTLSGILTLSSVFIGNHRLSLSRATETLKLADESGIHIYDFMIFACRAYVLLGTGDLDQVRAILEKMQETLIPFAVWDQGHYHFLNALYMIHAGKLSEASREAAMASQIVEACGNPFTIALSRVLQSQLLLETGEKSKAENLLISVIDDRRLGNSGLINFILKLALADSAYAHNCVEKGQLCLQEAFSIAKVQGMAMPFGLSKKRLGFLCTKALEAEIEEATVIEFIRCCNLQCPDPKTVSDRWPWPIRIYTLGRFAINCNDKPLRCSNKSPRKQLELLTFLISVGHRGVFKQMIAGRLWPDSDGDRAVQSLNTTLYRLRKLMGNDEAVTFKNGQLILNEKLCWVDGMHFEWLAQQIDITSSSIAQQEYIARALELYRGPYTTGYENMAVAVSYREQLEKLWFRVLAAAIPVFVERILDHQDVLQGALAADDTAVVVFPLFASAFNKEGRSVEALKVIDQCRCMLAEQGVGFGPRTLALLSKLEPM
jgi:ATP/maltotriose-dependent transcriptional regulator MalT